MAMFRMATAQGQYAPNPKGTRQKGGGLSEEIPSFPRLYRFCYSFVVRREQ
jgi:hypothetical protein